jgi:hypothetical protein
MNETAVNPTIAELRARIQCLEGRPLRKDEVLSFGGAARA